MERITVQITVMMSAFKLNQLFNFLIFWLVASHIQLNAENLDFKQLRESHELKDFTPDEITKLSQFSDMTKFKEILNPMLVERYADSDGNMMVQHHIKTLMTDLGWTIEEDPFVSKTPYGYKSFRNIIAKLDPTASRYLTLVCHFDSKYYSDFVFIGATDSAVPCAMMIDLARSLSSSLRDKIHPTTEAGVSLQLLFLDGEEAFKDWTATDSVYGARHLAEKWKNTPHPQQENSTLLDAIDVFILLDLVGAANPKFRNFFTSTSGLMKELSLIEQQLHDAGYLAAHTNPTEYFHTEKYYGHIEDDHLPFLREGVPVVHLICSPFPTVWHTIDDNESALDYPTIDNLNKIMRVFVARYLHLSVDSTVTLNGMR